MTRGLVGNFWAIGRGDPLVYFGHDSGAWPAIEDDCASGWLFSCPPYPAYFWTTWAADARIDGCIPSTPPELHCTVILFSDQIDGNGYFALLDAAGDNQGNFNYVQPDNGPIRLAAVPPPSVTTPLDGAPVSSVVLDPPVVPPEGLYLDTPGCNPPLILGYRVYKKSSPKNIPLPSDADRRNGWNVADGGERPSGLPLPLNESAVITFSNIDCLQDQYLAISLVFDSGFETTYLSTNSPAIQCANPCAGTDQDGDGFCTDVAPIDCDDGDATIHPGALSVCDGRNNNCLLPGWPSLVGTNEFDDDGDGLSECAGDCLDSEAQVFPSAPEICDGLVNNCEAPGWPQLPDRLEIDDDGDGFRECDGDCDDSDAGIFPGAPQFCNGINEDCNDPDWPAAPEETDNDSDGFSECEGDCNDGDESVSPSAAELCNEIDDNCNGLVDDAPLCQDEDGDGLIGSKDNCPDVPNADQLDTDGDGWGDLCDHCPEIASPNWDSDGDGLGNVCDNCPFDSNPGQEDTDRDGTADACDNCPSLATKTQVDGDGDRIGDNCDNCPVDFNSDQTDSDADGEGDRCDPDDGYLYPLLWPTRSTIDWPDEIGFTAWNVYAGDLGVLKQSGTYTQVPGVDPWVAQFCRIKPSTLVPGLFPPIGRTIFFLASGESATEEGGIGTDSSGASRPNDNPCP